MRFSYPLDFERAEGVFIERKNRFVVSVRVNNNKFDAYLPNPGRLWELLIPNRTELILAKNSNREKLPYTVIACRKNGLNVLLHTHLTNKVIAHLINSQSIPAYRGYRVLKEEIWFSKSRFDFLLSNGAEELYLEVKTCTLFGERVAMFPDAVTERGKRHLLELKELSDRGIRSSVLFAVMSPMVEYFLPAYHIDFEFAKAFVEVKDKVLIDAVTLEWDREFRSVIKVKEIKIPYDFIISEVQDSGVYLSLFMLKEPKNVQIGKIGDIEFKAGYYVYVGSAKRGLSQRIARHKRKGKKKHWHIDYLIEKSEFLKEIPIRTKEEIECQLADRIGEICDDSVEDFGASDCSCKSHLFYFRHNPIENSKFIELINFFRLETLRF